MFHREGMTVTSYAGPARSDSGSRKRVQLYNHHGGEHRLIDLSAEQWDALGAWFAEQAAGAERARPRSTTASTGTTTGS